MRILHFSSSMYPFQTGGTEVFINNLIIEQKSLKGITNVSWAIHDEKNLIRIASSLKNENKLIIKSPKMGNRIDEFSGDCLSIKSFDELLKMESDFQLSPKIPNCVPSLAIMIAPLNLSHSHDSNSPDMVV